jgi:hypothetical protein
MINEFLDRQRVNYFARFDELPAHRLCKIVFMELKNSECVEWKYGNYMRAFTDINFKKTFIQGQLIGSS